VWKSFRVLQEKQVTIFHLSKHIGIGCNAAYAREDFGLKKLGSVDCVNHLEPQA
jgi:hypothetical protein